MEVVYCRHAMQIAVTVFAQPIEPYISINNDIRIPSKLLVDRPVSPRGSTCPVQQSPSKYMSIPAAAHGMCESQICICYFVLKALIAISKNILVHPYWVGNQGEFVEAHYRVEYVLLLLHPPKTSDWHWNGLGLELV